MVSKLLRESTQVRLTGEILQRGLLCVLVSGLQRIRLLAEDALIRVSQRPVGEVGIARAAKLSGSSEGTIDLRQQIFGQVALTQLSNAIHHRVGVGRHIAANCLWNRLARRLQVWLIITLIGKNLLLCLQLGRSESRHALSVLTVGRRVSRRSVALIFLTRDGCRLTSQTPSVFLQPRR